MVTDRQSVVEEKSEVLARPENMIGDQLIESPISIARHERKVVNFYMRHVSLSLMHVSSQL